MLWDSKTKVDEIEQKTKELAKEKQREFEDLQKACKDIFKGNNGIYLLKFLKKNSFWDSQDMNINHDVLVYQKGRRDMWLILRSLLPKDILKEVEIEE